MDKREPVTAAQVQAEYVKGVAYNNGLNLYDKVKICEKFFEGDQWDGVKTETIRPVTMNFLTRIGLYKIANVVSDDVGRKIEPFLPDEAAEQAADVLTQSIDRVIERQKISAMHRELLRDGYVDGDLCLYFWFDADRETGMDGVQGDIRAESLMNTNVLFGNPHSARTQEQPYILIVRRRPVREARQEAERAGIEDWESIRGESDGLYKGDDEQTGGDDLCTEITRFWKGEDKRVRFCKAIGTVLTQKETTTEMTLYPLAYASWMPRKNSYHGVREMDSLIDTQIAVNKLWTALDIQVRNNALPKLVYNRKQFPDGWNPAAKYIGVMGDVKEALTGVAGSMPIPGEVTNIMQQMVDNARDFAGANDAALGNIKNPDNTSAIVATQQANAAPLALQRLMFYQFVEDYTRVIIDMMHAYYGIRAVKVKHKATDQMTGESTEMQEVVMYDFGALPVSGLDLNIEIGAASYWAETLQTATLDNMQKSGMIPDPVEYLERVPDGMIPDKAGLVEAVRRAQQIQAQQAVMPTM